MKKICLAMCGLILFFSCTPPRSMLSSGKVVPKKQFRFGINYTFNVSSAPITQSVKGAYKLSQTIANKDTIRNSSQVRDVNAALIAYCVDPITFNDELYFRYGLGHYLDVGYRNAGGAHAFDMMYQFLGSNENFNNSTYNGMYGSTGLQYSWKNYNFSDNPILKQLQKMYFMDMQRKDVTVPVVFSKSWGPEERTGCFSFGVMYSHTFIKYKISTKNIYQAADQLDPNGQVTPYLLTPVEAKVHYGAYGAFFNLKIGKKAVFFNVSLAAYYQNYGKYLLLGGSTVELKGFTIVPSYGVQFNILGKQKKKVVSE
ncbi:MAG: hypothetical protein ACXVPQ_13185 [Bacteroidia bacterium]